MLGDVLGSNTSHYSGDVELFAYKEPNKNYIAHAIATVLGTLREDNLNVKRPREEPDLKTGYLPVSIKQQIL